jgi:hypothetical protein
MFKYTLTCELDLLCTAAAADLVANLIFFSEKKSVGEKSFAQKKSFAKTAYKGITRGN